MKTSQRGSFLGFCAATLFLIGAAFVVGCIASKFTDKVVSSERGPTEMIEKQISCSYAGVCYASGINFDGSVGYKFGFHASCPGDQQARVGITGVTRTHESGKVSVQEEEEVLERLTACEG